MTFGTNAQRLMGQRLGVGRYLEYLIKHWSRLLSGSETMVLYSRDRLDTSGLPLNHAFRLEQPGPKLTNLLWEQQILAARAHVDVLFGPAYRLPLAYRGPTVVATHSVNETQPGAHPWWYFVYQQLYQRSARKAHFVIVPSESTKTDVQRVYGIPAEKIEVVPQGANDEFRPLNQPERESETRRRLLGEDRPYVLFVGKLSQRRNIPLLISAFAAMKKRTGLPHHLLLFGPNHLQIPIGEIAARDGIADSVLQTDGKVASHEELVDVYNAADVFVHPSSYEGWSMTTMEALACGTAVVAMNRGGLGEVAAGHALMVDEPAISPLAEAIAQVLTEPVLRRELQRKARLRGSAFTWEDTSRRTLEVIRRAA